MRVQYKLPVGFSVPYYMHGRMHGIVKSTKHTLAADISLRVVVLFQTVMQSVFQTIGFIPSLCLLHYKIISVRGMQCFRFLHITLCACKILFGTLALSLLAVIDPHGIYDEKDLTKRLIKKPCISLLVEMLPELPELLREMKLNLNMLSDVDKLQPFREEIVNEMMKCAYIDDEVYSLEQIVVDSKRFDDYFKAVLERLYSNNNIKELFTSRSHQGAISDFTTNYIESFLTKLMQDILFYPSEYLKSF